jgi:hypothetical protein
MRHSALGKLADGGRNRRVPAERMSDATLALHVARLLGKRDARDRTQAVVLAPAGPALCSPARA